MSRDNSMKRARAGGKVREDRAMTNRKVTENRELSDSERVDLLRRSLFQSSLPDLPKIPGYHVFWATTTNPRDSIAARLQLGYEFIRSSEVPEFENLNLKTGDYAGCIGVNEMVAMKLPLHLYEMYMRENHHDSPIREQESIYNDAMSVNEAALQKARRGGKVKGPVIEPGTEDLGTAREPPNFSESDQYE